MSSGFVIAIDGPVASGKGTLATELAESLNGFHLYTGAFYRCLTLFCLENNIDLSNENAIVEAENKIRVEYKDQKIFLNNIDVTQRIQQKDVTNTVPIPSKIQRVRDLAVIFFRQVADEKIREGKILIVDSRIAGTIEFPNAPVKIFLTASAESRAKRRCEQMKHLGTYEQVLADIKKRDSVDINRTVEPLAKNPKKEGYFVLDNSTLSKVETLNIVINLLQERGLI